MINSKYNKIPHTKSITESLGLSVVKLHEIRQTNVTLLISQNVDIVTISAGLGHISEDFELI